MASAYNSLEWGLGSQKEIEAGLRRREHQILATRQVVSGKYPGLWLCRKEFPKRWKVVKKVKRSLRRKTVQDLWIDKERVVESSPCGSFVGGVCNFHVSLSQQISETGRPVLQLSYNSVLFRKQRIFHPRGVRVR